MFSRKGRLGGCGWTREAVSCAPFGLCGQCSECHDIFLLFPFSSFGRECLVDPNILVHFGTTCIVNVSISPFRQHRKINVTSEAPWGYCVHYKKEI